MNFGKSIEDLLVNDISCYCKLNIVSTADNFPILTLRTLWLDQGFPFVFARVDVFPYTIRCLRKGVSRRSVLGLSHARRVDEIQRSGGPLDVIVSFWFLVRKFGPVRGLGERSPRSTRHEQGCFVGNTDPNFNNGSIPAVTSSDGAKIDSPGHSGRASCCRPGWASGPCRTLQSP